MSNYLAKPHLASNGALRFYVGQSPGAWLSAVATLALTLVFCSPAPAADTSWKAGSGYWSVASNWTGGVPGSSSNACIANGGTANIAYQIATCGTLSLGGGATGSAVQMSGGSLAVKWKSENCWLLRLSVPLSMRTLSLSNGVSRLRGLDQGR